MRALTPERWRALEPLLDRVFEATAAERAEVAVSLAGEDAELRAELAALVAAAQATDGILERTADEYVQILTGGAEPDDDLAGERVGPWQIRSEIGRGGMGVVYLAERVDGAFEQRVALKLLRRGIDTDEVLDRFRRERRILARLEHPNIARVLDGGATADGRPYFAMEAVEGQSITTWCDSHRLGIEERLRLFLDVCAAVQHAHRRLVVHRDLKPSNILVTASGEVKLLDFGIAKLLSAEDGDELTRTGLRPMTPRYAAPEQVRGEAVTTATDTYALGVVLYELLVGRSPYRTTRAGEAELERAILEQEPDPPSRALGRRGATGEEDSGEASTQAAARRGTSLERLRRQLQGDLDAIVLAALRKETDRRYPSADALARDVERYLDGLPIAAQKDTFRYRAGKFVLRHRFGVGVTTLGVVALVAFAATMAGQARQIAQQRDRAERVSQFLVELFRVSDPSEARGNTITAREVLDRGEQRIDQELREQPELQGQLMDTMGSVYGALGLWGKAEQLFARAVEVRKRVLGQDHPQTLTSTNSLANILVRRGRYDEGERHFETALEGRRRVLGADHRDTLKSMNDLAFWYGVRGRYEKAEALHREVLETRQRVLGPEHIDTLWSMNDLAVIHARQGRYQESEKILLEVLGIWRRLKRAEDPDVFMGNLAGAYQGQGRYKDAEQIITQQLEAKRKLLGAEHPVTLMCMKDLAIVYHDEGRFDESEKLQRETMEVRQRVLGPEHPGTLESMYWLAVVCRDLERNDEAEKLQLQTLEMQRRVLGLEHPETLTSMANLGRVYGKQGRRDEAERLIREAFEIQQRTLGVKHPETVGSAHDLACVLALGGRREQALEWLRQAVAAGYRRADRMAREPDFRSLRGDPEFQRLLAAAQSQTDAPLQPAK